jgi:two-component system sensor histidine kinase RegB
MMEATMVQPSAVSSGGPNAVPVRRPASRSLRLDAERDAAPSLALPWVVRLRYGMVFGGLATLAIAVGLLGVHLSWRGTLGPLLAVLLTNVWLQRASRSVLRSPQIVLGAIFAFDTLCLTAILALTGGPMNPFSLLYLVQITLAAVVLERLWTSILVLLSTLCFGLLFFTQMPMGEGIAHAGEHGLEPHLVGMWIAFVIAATLISFFTGRVSDALRLRELEVLTLLDRVARQERLASLVTLAAGAAHELGTPLGTIAVVARELERYASRLNSREGLADDARLIRSEVERCQLILQRMSADGAEPVGESPHSIQVGELLYQTLGEIPDPERSHISIETESADTSLLLPVRATIQSLAALLGNALDAGAENARVILRATQSGSTVVFSVTDNGSGMGEEVMRRIAEPFFTTKEPGRGMGLGTFLVRTFAERMGGELSYESCQGRGTTATLILPAQFSPIAEGDRVHA